MAKDEALRDRRPFDRCLSGDEIWRVRSLGSEVISQKVSLL